MEDKWLDDCGGKLSAMNWVMFVVEKVEKALLWTMDTGDLNS